jgi:hypothetical protein
MKEMSASQRDGQRGTGNQLKVRFQRGRRTPGLLLLDKIGELIEKVGSVVWSRRRFRMVLHTEDREFLVPHSFHGAVV